MNDAKVLDSQIGELNVDEERNIINWTIALALPIANKFLNQGLTLPSEFFGMVRIREAFFQPMNGFIQVGIVPEFI